jgi:hypothetical protein
MSTDRGFGLIRRDGTETVLYSKLCDMLAGAGPGDGTEIPPKNIVTGASDGERTEIPSEYIVTAEYFKSLGPIEKWLFLESGFARGAKISELKKNLSPLPGWVIHTRRVESGPVGDKIAYKGEEVSVYIPKDSPPFRVR